MWFYEFILPIGILSASLTLFINYIIGKPGSEFSPYEIFSSYTVWIAKRRLKSIKLLDTYQSQYNENLPHLHTQHERITFNNDFKKMLYNAADPYFTWERAVGMCSICTGFWISLFIGLIFTFNISEIIEIIVISHITIRILNKIL